MQVGGGDEGVDAAAGGGFEGLAGGVDVARSAARQRIERIDADALPVDVTLVLDVSGFTGGAWTRNVPPARVLAESAAKAREIAAVLRPDDRVRVIVSDTYNRRIAPWTAARDIAAPEGDKAIVTSISTASFGSRASSVSSGPWRP